jgi:CheY-like chemotaxis protein
MKRIFVVDDNQLTRILAAAALRDLGWEVEAYSAIDDAWAAAKREPPDAMVVDHVMPAGKGSELVRAVRGSPDARLSTMRVLGLTGASGEELLESGVDLCLRKPLSEAALEAALEKLGLA